MNTVPRSLVALSRALLVVATAGTLAGCFETTGASFTNPFATSALDPQAPPVAAQGGRGGTSDYLTADKAKSACWMQAETDKKAPKDLEKRGKWVDKCAAAKLRDQATQWASTNSQPAPAPAPSAAPFSFPGSLFGTPTSAPAEPRSSPSGADVQQKGM